MFNVEKYLTGATFLEYILCFYRHKSKLTETFVQFPLLKPDVIVAKLSRNSPVVTTSRKCCRVCIYTEMNKFTRNDTLVLYG